MRLVIVLLLGFFPLLHSCTSEKSSRDYRIEGKVENYGGKTIVFERVHHTYFEFVDSLIVKGEGVFQFDGHNASPGIYRIGFGGDKFIYVCLRDELVKINVDIQEFENYSIDGVENGEAFKHIVINQSQQFGNYLNFIAELRKVSRKDNPDEWRAVEKNADKTLFLYKDYIRSTIRNTSDPYVAYFASRMLDRTEDFNFLNQFSKRIERELGGASYAIEFDDEMREQRKNLRIGMDAKMIKGNNHKGNVVSTEDSKGKIVLVQFWASFCDYSRYENRKLSLIMNDDRAKDFSIFNVSMDEDELAWKEAIPEDSMTWNTQLFLRPFKRQEYIDFYKMKGVPENILIGRDGKILTRNVRSSELESMFDLLIQLH